MFECVVYVWDFWWDVNYYVCLGPQRLHKILTSTLGKSFFFFPSPTLNFSVPIYNQNMPIPNLKIWLKSVEHFTDDRREKQTGAQGTLNRHFVSYLYIKNKTKTIKSIQVICHSADCLLSVSYQNWWNWREFCYKHTNEIIDHPSRSKS